MTNHDTSPTPQVSAEDREALIDALEKHWLEQAAAKTVDSPRGHCARTADMLIAAGWRPAPTPVEQARPDALEITKAITEAIHEHREDFQRPSEAGTAVAVYERLAHLGMIDRRSAASPVPAEGDEGYGLFQREPMPGSVAAKDQAERDYDGAVEHYSRVIAVRERQIARLREQRDAARNGHAELSRQRDQWWEHVGQEKAALRAERDALQSRIDAALALCDEYDPVSFGPFAAEIADRFRAALRTPEGGEKP